MTDFYRINTVKAAKPHRCDQCGKTINMGDKHFYSAYMVDGDFNTSREHLDCRDLWLEIRTLRELSWDETSDFLIDDGDLHEDEEWIRKERPTVAARLFGDAP